MCFDSEELTMIVDVRRTVCNGSLLKWLLAAGLAWLEHNAETVNRLNVFPVPDGDTGTNMLLTIRKAYSEVMQSDETHVGLMSAAVARGALRGARGNSGVILSQLLAGFARGLEGHEVFDAPLFARACQSAVKSAYAAVIEPVEGTILTVSREAVEAIIERSRLETDLVVLLETLVDAAKASLKRTPELLPVLKKAGVVDSGGQGFVYIIEGMLRLIRGEPVNVHLNGAVMDTQNWQEALEPEDEEGYGYDVQFLMHGENMDVDQIRRDIDAMGWSTLVVGDSQLIKVHVHVHDPGEPLSYAIRTGAELDDLVVENMQRQYKDYVKNREARAEEEDLFPPVNDGVAVIAVVNGDGMKRLFKNDLSAAAVISGGQTMNPSTEDFIAAIQQLPNDEIILLPNNKNIILAAQQAAKMTEDKIVHVVPSRTVQQGVSAMFAYNNMRDVTLDEMIAGMNDAMAQIASGEVTRAVRDADIDGVPIKEGQIIGLLNGRLVLAADDYLSVVTGLLLGADAHQRELVTLYYGGDLDARQAHDLVEAIADEFHGLEFEIVHGGQPLYPYLISIE